MIKYIYPVSGKIYAYLFGREFFNAFNNFLHYLSLRGLGYLNYKNKSISGENSFAKNYISSLYALDKYHRTIIFDVGANKGQYLSSLYHYHNRFTVECHAFEPSPLAFKVLKENFGNNNLIHLNNIGLSDFTGEALLYDYVDDENDNLGSQHASLNQQVIETVHMSKSCSTKVKIEKGDIYCEQNNILQIDLLKIDVEGLELDVLKGFSRMIKEERWYVLMVCPNNDSFRLQITDFMRVLPGFEFYRLLPSGGKVSIESHHYPVYYYHNVLCFPSH